MDVMSQTPNPWQPSQPEPEPDPWATRPRSDLPFGDEPTAELPSDPEATAIQAPVADAPRADASEAPPVPVPPSPAPPQNPYAAYGAQPQQPPMNPYAPPAQQPYAASGASAGYPSSASSAPYGPPAGGFPPGYQPQPGGYGQPAYGGQPYPQKPVEQTGAFGALFDFSFTRTDVAPRIAKIVNIFAVVCFGAWWLLWSAGLFGALEYLGGASMFFRFAFGWLPALVGIGLVRLVTEGVLAVVRAADHAGEIAERATTPSSGTDEG